MSISDTSLIPATDRDAVRGRAKPEPPRDTGPSPKPARISSRYAFKGTSGPLARIAPDPPTVLTTSHRNNQRAIGQYVTNAIRSMWQTHIDPSQFSASWNDLGPVLKVIIGQHYVASAADAAAYYRNMHVVHGFGMPKVQPAQLSGSHLNRMAGSVANGTFYHYLNTKGLPPYEAGDKAMNVLSGAGTRFALNGARNTVMNAVAIDPDASGWDRLIEPDACSYCAMQAAKGPFKPGNTTFRAHDYCHCLATPKFKGGSKPGSNSALQDKWNQITGTYTGKDAREAWDKYWRENATDATARDNTRTQEPS